MNGRRDEQWPRNAWLEAVWSSQLRTAEKVVALAYADHARDADTAWVAAARLAKRTALSARSVVTARNGLIASGWLCEIKPAAQQRSALYRLTYPPGLQIASPRSAAAADLGSSGLQIASPGLQIASPRSAAAAPHPNDQRTNTQKAERGAESPMKPEALALWSQTHRGHEREALEAALDHERRRGVEVSHPTAYFATWTRERRAAIRLPGTKTPAIHTKPWCGHCDSPTTRRIEDDQGNLTYEPDGSVRRCTCWTPRNAGAVA